MAATLEREYTTVDKAGWGPGDWQDEPDKVQWVDEATGLDCLAVRGPGGHWCGYVGVPPEHPWHGNDYDDPASGAVQPRKPARLGVETVDYDHPDAVDYDAQIGSQIDVHGGLTYADSCQEDRPEEEGICHVAAPGRPANVWWFGFDCAHLGDLSPRYARDGLRSHVGEYYRPLTYVKAECASLAKQLAEVSAGGR